METRLFLDESGELITIDKLKREYESLKLNNETEIENFADYIKVCTEKNGTLTEI